jgi:hypothetical protein
MLKLQSSAWVKEKIVEEKSPGGYRRISAASLGHFSPADYYTCACVIITISEVTNLQK